MVDVAGKFGSFVKGQRSWIEMVLIVLILINWAPTELLGSDLNSRLNSMLGPIMTPVKSVMSNVFVRLFLWLILLWSCCYTNDRPFFFLVAIYFLTSR
jgi:hypothetical protein